MVKREMLFFFSIGRKYHRRHVIIIAASGRAVYCVVVEKAKEFLLSSS